MLMFTINLLSLDCVCVLCFVSQGVSSPRHDTMITNLIPTDIFCVFSFLGGVVLQKKINYLIHESNKWCVVKHKKVRKF